MNIQELKNEIKLKEEQRRRAKQLNEKKIVRYYDEKIRILKNLKKVYLKK